MLSARVLTRFGSLLCLVPVACGGDDGPSDPPKELGLAATLCESRTGQVPVVPSADGKRVAFLSCAELSPTVVVHDLETSSEVTLGEAPEDSSVEWLPSARAGDVQEYLLFGTPNELWVRAADAATEAVLIAENTAAAHRAVLQRVSNTEFAPRLHLLETTEETRILSIRGPDDGYAIPTLIYMGDAIEADLSQISASGRTLILTPSETDGQYLQAQWNATQAIWQTSSLSFGPAQWVMAPVGLGDTHNFALHDDRLVRIELKTGAISELVPAGEGLLDGASHLIDREDAPGVKYVYYILNGDPTRRDRDGMMEPETLADADAVAQRLTPDLSTLLFLSDGMLYGLPAEGGDPTILVEAQNQTDRIDLAFPLAGSRFAYTVQGAVYRVEPADDSSSVISGASAVEGSVRYDGEGSAIFFLDDSGQLLRVPEEAVGPEPVATSVTDYWPVPNSTKVLAVADGKLQVFAFDAPKP